MTQKRALFIVLNVVVVIGVVTLIIVGYSINLIGLNAQSIQLIIAPTFLIAGAIIAAFVMIWVNILQSRNQQKLAQVRDQTDYDLAINKQREDELQAYLDRMTDLLLEKHLRESKPDDEVRYIARARTVSLLRGLDPARKRIVIQFLQESGLIRKNSGSLIINADLSSVDLSNADLREADLTSVNLSGANLREANLKEANLNKADLRKVNLLFASLDGATLLGAELGRANLQGASLANANLSSADLYQANLSKAHLYRSNLRRARLHEAKLHDTYLGQANLSGAILDGADLSEAVLSKAIVTKEQIGFVPKAITPFLGKLETIAQDSIPFSAQEPKVPFLSGAIITEEQMKTLTVEPAESD